jgi:hypothetical protein
MRIIIFLTLIIFCPVIYAQDWTVIADDMHFEAQMGKEPVSAMGVYEKIAGTPFLNPQFVNGSLITNDSLMYTNIPLRYNVFKDEMEFRVGDEEIPRIIANPRSFLFIHVDSLVFQYLAFSDNNRPAQGYFQVLNEGPCQVMMRRRTDYAEPKGAHGFDKALPARFEEKRNTYFVRFGRQLPQEVRFTRRNILKTFEEKQGAITDFVKENNLSYRSIDDLIKIAAYYNELSE